MLAIILATARPEALQAFAEALASDQEVHLQQAPSGLETLRAVRTSAPHLVVIDTVLPDTEPLGLVQQLLQVNAMVNIAVLSPLSEAEFHEESEGLGVLGRLPTAPGSRDAAELLEKLRRILGMTG
jgi:DNA-binding response OmpR family regulator